MGKAVRMEEARNADKILLWKFQGKRNYLGNLALREKVGIHLDVIQLGGDCEKLEELTVVITKFKSFTI